MTPEISIPFFKIMIYFPLIIHIYNKQQQLIAFKFFPPRIMCWPAAKVIRERVGQQQWQILCQQCAILMLLYIQRKNVKQPIKLTSVPGGETGLVREGPPVVQPEDAA